MFKIRLRSNPSEEIIVHDLIEFINSFELGFRPSQRNEPYLKRKSSDNPYAVEIIYIENIADNWQYMPEAGYVCTLTQYASRDDHSWAFSAAKIDTAKKCEKYIAVNPALHKDYAPMLEQRLKRQKQAQEQREAQEKKLKEDTQKQIEMLKDLARENGLNLALDYIHDMDDEE